ncbi:hypothetical protein ACOQFB_22670 [Anaeromyxobacter sp. Red801]|uniref:hypothetical protein n=1 Tax=Anaeromyxobacter sp. Red801 TaxID=3411632 RepID=UPI003B9E26D5
MKKLLIVVLPLGLAILGGASVLSGQRTAQATAESRLERARLKREFAERAALARALPPERAVQWSDEATSLLGWYSEGLKEIRARFPGVEAAPTALAAAEAERKGKLADKDRAAIEDFQKYADGRAALLKARWAPVQSVQANGLRLDLVAIEPGASPGGGPGLRIDFALWGAPRLVDREKTGDRTVTRVISPVSFDKIGFRFLDAAGKPYGEMSGPGEPYQKLVDAERFVEDFPPGVMFGTWWVELLPREAATVELDLGVNVRGAGGSSVPAAFHVSMPVAEPWKIPPGAVYQAEVREAAQ